MDIVVEGVLIHNPNDIETFPVRLSQDNFLLVKEKLDYERSKIVGYFKALKQEGVIKSNHRPKNKKIQKHLDELVKLKKKMKNSIEKIDMIYKWTFKKANMY